MKPSFIFQPGASLHRQMLSIFTLGLVLLTSLLLWLNDHNIRQREIDKAASEQSGHAAFFAALIDSDVSQSLTSLSVRAENLQRAGMTTNFKSLQESLTRLQESLPKYAWVGYADLQGVVRASSGGLLNRNSVATRPWFIEGQKRQTTIDVHDALLLAQMLRESADHAPLRFIDVATPVRDDKDGVLGVLAAHLSVNWLTERVNFYNLAISNAEELQPFVIGHDGMFRFGNKSAFDGLDALDNLWRSKEASGHMILPHRDYGATLVSYAKHTSQGLPSDMGWVTVTVKPVSAIMAAAHTERLASASGILTLALLIWLLVYRLLKWANQPVQQLIHALEDAQRNETVIGELNGLPREFSQIRTEINKLLIDLRDRENRLQNVLSQVNSSFHGVTESFPGVLFSLEDKHGAGFEFSYLSTSVSEYFSLDGQVPQLAEAFFALVLVDKSPAHLEQMRSRFLNNAPLDFVEEIYGKSGAKRHMRFKGQPRILSNGNRAWDGIAIDVTDLITAEQSALAADEAKSRFLATMSHEIRTPLNGILGFAQILYEEQKTPQAQQDVQKIIDTADTLTRILNDVLDFSKIEAGKIELESRPFTFVELTNAVRDIFSAEAKQRSLEFALTLLGNPGQTLLGDPIRLRQIITNLVSNAMKFTSHGQVALSVVVQEAAHGHAKVRISVKDTGIGITQEHMQRLYQRFEQSDSATFRRYGGSGLGLAIVKGLVDSMGGTVAVESKIGHGTSFVVDVDFTVVQSSSVHADKSIHATVRPLRILVVDDVGTNRDVVCRGLKRDGHEFSQAADGLQALRLAQSQHFDLILMDLDMPIMDGHEAAREIRRDSLNQDTFIIALSGFAYDTDVTAVQESGMNLHLAKPLSLRKLRTVMLEQFGEA